MVFCRLACQFNLQKQQGGGKEVGKVKSPYTPGYHLTALGYRQRYPVAEIIMRLVLCP